FVADGGFVHRVDAATGRIDWAYDARRPECPLDLVEGVPEVRQPRYSLNPSAKRDLVIFGTRQRCGGGESNRVIALLAATGEVAWPYNATALGAITAPASLDSERDRAILGAQRTGSPAGETLIALDIESGAKVWGADTGDDVRVILGISWPATQYRTIG